jgi:hypothetical protein
MNNYDKIKKKCDEKNIKYVEDVKGRHIKYLRVKFNPSKWGTVIYVKSTNRTRIKMTYKSKSGKKSTYKMIYSDFVGHLK